MSRLGWERRGLEGFEGVVREGVLDPYGSWDGTVGRVVAMETGRIRVIGNALCDGNEGGMDIRYPKSQNWSAED